LEKVYSPSSGMTDWLIENDNPSPAKLVVGWRAWLVLPSLSWILAWMLGLVL